MNTKSDLEERNRPTTAGSEYFETVIIGGGQAGLSVGYHLKKQGRPFVILDANERIGDAWRKRWDSLRLFTPARYNGWQAGASRARRVVSHEGRDGRLPRILRCSIRSACSNRRQGGRTLRADDRYVLTSGGRRFEAEHVVVATGANQSRRFPPSPTNFIRASCSSIRASTAAHLSSRKAPFWWWARATPERRSLSRCPARIPHTSLASPRDRSPSVTDPLWRDSSSP